MEERPAATEIFEAELRSEKIGSLSPPFLSDMTSSMLRRQLKNLVQNYSEAEVKVREATSNDPWGPSSSQMADISDLTYNVVACNEIMTMLWKRLKDDKNWRHIHKSLTLLEYLLKTGDERVLLKMKDNIYIVKALTEYRFVDKDGKDQGVNVREKAKVVLVLMEDDEKLKEERDFALKTREKTSKSAAASSADVLKDPNYKPCYVPGASGLPTLENIPSVADLTASFAARKEERLKQEAEKKEAERRAKLSEDELKWEDAGKGPGVKPDAWGGQKSEEEEEPKPNPWGAPKEPKEATGPWGTPDRPDTAETTESTDAWGAPAKTEEDPFAKTDEDPFAAPKNGGDLFVAADEEDPFAAPKDDPFTSKDSSDPFSAPKDTQSREGKPDPFTASKDDPFSTPKDDPFKAPKDDPFNTPKEDPFSTPRDDPFSTPKDDPFTSAKEDPFNSSKDDPFTSPKEDPFSTPKDDTFTPAKEDPFHSPKDDPFTPVKDDPFSTPKDDTFTSAKEDPFSTPKDDPFSTPNDDLFTSAKEAPTSPSSKEDPFSTSSKPIEDPFAAPTTPPKQDPFSTPSKPTEDPFASPTSPPKKDPFSASSMSTGDPFAAHTTPPKEEPFVSPTSPPKDYAADPFSASSPQDKTDAWHETVSSPPATVADVWGVPSPTQETTAGGPWGAEARSPTDDSDPFGDATKPDNDPWGTPAPAPLNSDDAWGSPAPPSGSSPMSDPFGDGASKSDPWGAPSGTGRRCAMGEEMYKKTASFLGSAGSSLVDLDDLFSCNPKPKHVPVANAMSAQTRTFGTLNAPLAKTLPVTAVSYPQASALPGSHFGSTLAPSYPPFGAARQSTESSPFQSQVVKGSHFDGNTAFSVFGVQMTQPGSLFEDPFLAAAGLQQTGAAPPMGGGVSNQLFLSSSTTETNKNYNPFLF